VADAVATYRVDLEDGTSGPARDAVDALGKLKKQIDADNGALRELEKAFKQLNSAQVVNIKAAQDLRNKIAAKKQAISDAQAAYSALGGTYGKTAAEGKKTLSLVEKLREATKAAPGPVGTLVARLGGLRAILVGGAIVAGTVAIVAGLAALVAATAAAGVALFRYGVAQADARRNELLRLEGLTKLRFWYRAAAGSATELQAATDKVAAGVAIGRDQVAQYTDKLYRAGLRGQNLADALEAVAIKASVQGEAAASAFAGWAAGTALAGGSVKKLADDVRARLGGIAARQMLSLDVQSKKLHESLAALFHGLNLEPLLRGLRMVTELLSQATPTGRALKAILTQLFQPVINGAETAGLTVKRFFQGMTIAALTVGIALLKVRNWMREAFGGSDLLKSIDGQKLAVYAGVAAFGALAAALTVAAGAAVVLTTAFAALASPFFILLGLRAATIKAIDYLAGVDWKTLGTNIVEGIASGVTRGASAVVQALKNVAARAMAAFKSALGIASPSKEFAKLGLALPQGVEKGVDQGAPAAQAAVVDMVRAPDAPAPAPARGRGPGPSAGATPVHVTIAQLIVQSAATDAAGIAQDIRAELIRALETLGVQLGAPA